MSGFLGFVIILGAIAGYSLLPGLFRVFYLGLGLMILVWWGLRSHFKRLVIAEDLSKCNGFAGSKLLLNLRITNPSRFPVFWGTVTKSFPEPLGAKFVEALVAIPPRGRADIQMAFYPQRRGIYPAPETRLTCGDPFGFKEITIKQTPPEQIIIYPQIFPVLGLHLVRHFPLGQNRVVFGLHEDPSRPRGCRDYSPGDSIRKIHWPNVARTGRLKVKEWETTLTEEIAIFLNLAEADYPVSEWSWLSELGIEFAASLTHLLIAGKETLGFYCNGKAAGSVPGAVFKLAPKHGYSQEKRILEYLAGATLDPESPYELLFSEVYRQSAGSCLLFITPRITPKLVQQVQNLIRAGYHPVILWLKVRYATGPPANMVPVVLPCYTVEKRRDNSAILITRTQRT